ncbi:MAG: hypothetical protein F6K14_09190 [Symploca sp. SIO2C1]|nr:hypothetical protein [Symploca sp. SIO2C1]
MTEDRWIHSLEANKLMRSPEEVSAFEHALAQLAENPYKENLPALQNFKQSPRDSSVGCSVGAFKRRDKIVIIPRIYLEYGVLIRS